ncbi:MAG: nucleoside monophosphate kinase [Candidatus Aminicenantes bacterium]|nr:nucleoside monophosphate kinase [Candidatus Aminicenantes bacterium]
MKKHPWKNLDKLKDAVRGKKIILFGPPGSGKGNRSRDLEALGLVHVSSGIALRAAVKDDPESALSKNAASYMEQGALVPDEIIVPIIMEHLSQEKCQTNGFILDGFPRTQAQADALFSKIKIDLALYLDVPRKFLVFGIIEGNRRICVECATGYSDFDLPHIEGICNKCGGKLIKRTDDHIETIEKRLKLYDEQTTPFLPYIKMKTTLEILSITVRDEKDVDEKYLKTLKGQVYWVETDQGVKARMLNLEGMRERLYNLLAENFL